MKIDIRKNMAVYRDYSDPVIGELFYFCFTLRSRIFRIYKQHQLHNEVKRERRQLANLTDRELEDMGISRRDATAESHRTGIKGLPVERLS